MQQVYLQALPSFFHFDIHRDEKIIKLIKEKADGYDQQLKQKADSLMQKKLNE